MAKVSIVTKPAMLPDPYPEAVISNRVWECVPRVGNNSRKLLRQFDTGGKGLPNYYSLFNLSGA
jgi:hypothetical protein